MAKIMRIIEPRLYEELISLYQAKLLNNILPSNSLVNQTTGQLAESAILLPSSNIQQEDKEVVAKLKCQSPSVSVGDTTEVGEPPLESHVETIQPPIVIAENPVDKNVLDATTDTDQYVEFNTIDGWQDIKRAGRIPSRVHKLVKPARTRIKPRKIVKNEPQKT